jgi:hypothetical protein
VTLPTAVISVEISAAAIACLMAFRSATSVATISDRTKGAARALLRLAS